MHSVCIGYTPDKDVQNLWSFVLENFGVTKLYVRGGAFEDTGLHILRESVPIQNVSELPGPIVVLAPQFGRFVKGTESLVDFKHPEDAVYLFGEDKENLPPEIAQQAAHIVYVPCGEVFAHIIGAVVLYDRLVKNG